VIRRRWPCFRPPVTPSVILACVAAYFAVLIGVAWWTGRAAGNEGYFRGNRRSPWVVVALGLIGDSLSGVSYISVPGKVARDHFEYLAVVFGYALGYLVICGILLPIYYRLGLTSIYGFLGQRFGPAAQKTGSGFFLLSRVFGSSARLLLSITVFQTFVFDAWGVPFWTTAAVIIGLILIYTLQGGIKTLVWTDTIQSGFLVLGVVVCAGSLLRQLDVGPVDLLRMLRSAPETAIYNGDWRSAGFFWKQLVSGAAIAVVMTGLDQNNMQKTLSCKTLSDARKNFALFTPIMVLVNLAILVLGALLFRFAAERGIGIPARTDELFPRIALQHLGTTTAVVFLLGLTAATFNSADSVLTTLTTSLCVDFLGFEQRKDLGEEARVGLRRRVHVAFAGVLLATILIFRSLAEGLPLIDVVLKVAGYTYGPLLGLFFVGLATRIRVSGAAIPVVALVSMFLAGILDLVATRWWNGFRFGTELILVNALMTGLGLVLCGRFQSRAVPRDC
jgi:Na+/proline symporter